MLGRALADAEPVPARDRRAVDGRIAYGILLRLDDGGATRADQPTVRDRALGTAAAQTVRHSLERPDFKVD